MGVKRRSPKARKASLVATRRGRSRRAPERVARRQAAATPSSATADGGRPDAAIRAATEISRQLLKAYRYVEVSPESVVAEARARGLVVSSLEELRAQPLAKRDALQTTFVKSAKIWATSHGTTLGSAGLVTVGADVAALVAVNLRMVQQIAYSYGVHPAPERVDGWALLLAALGASEDPATLREVGPDQARELAARLLEETAVAFARRLGGRQAGRAVPIVGAVFGGLSNYAFTAEVGSRARAFYRALAP